MNAEGMRYGYGYGDARVKEIICGVIEQHFAFSVDLFRRIESWPLF